MDLMSIITYPATSPYSVTPQTNSGIGLFVYKPIPPNKGDVTYTITARQNFRPDLASYDLYNTAAYWWVFAARNPRLRANIIFGFTAGLTIIVPSADYVRQAAGS